MADIILQFGSGNPQGYTGLTPTLITFSNLGGSAVTGPGVTAIPGTGLYYFNYAATNSMVFTADGFTTSLSGPERYVSGYLSADDSIGSSLTSLGASLNALSASMSVFGNSFTVLGTSLSYLYTQVGNTTSSFGTTNTDPGSLFGYLKRLQEFNEGNATFTKSTGLWDIYSRGSSYLLTEKTLADTATNVTKT